MTSRRKVVGLLFYFCLSLFVGCKDEVTQPESNNLFQVEDKKEIANKIITSSGGPVSGEDREASTGVIVTANPNAFTSENRIVITSAKFKSNVRSQLYNPVTSLIGIAFDGSVKDPLLVSIECKIPKDMFAMAFAVNPSTGSLEALPFVTRTSLSVITQITKTTNIIVSWVKKEELYRDAQSNFKPSLDNWEFSDAPTAVRTNGTTVGHTLSAYWYFRNQKSPRLYGAFQKFSPVIERLRESSNAQGHHLVAYLDSISGWNIAAISFPAIYKQYQIPTSEQVYLASAYAVLLTKQPQIIGIPRGSTILPFILYRVYGGNMFISDPKYPSDDNRFVQLWEGEQLLYEAGTPFESKAVSFFGSAYVNEDEPVNAWKKLEEGSIAKEIRMPYLLTMVDKNYTEFKVNDQTVFESAVKFPITPGFNVTVITKDSVLSYDANGFIKLREGLNEVGLQISRNNKWVDFLWLNLSYVPYQIAPPQPLAIVGVPIKLKLKHDGDWSQTPVVWNFGDGTSATSIINQEISHVYTKTGSFEVTSSIESKSITVKRSLVVSTGGALITSLQKTVKMEVVFNNVTANQDKAYYTIAIPVGSITWNGLSFSGSGYQGVFAQDGLNIRTFQASISESTFSDTESHEYTREVDGKEIPFLSETNDRIVFQLQGSKLKDQLFYIASYDQYYSHPPKRPSYEYSRNYQGTDWSKADSAVVTITFYK